MKDILGTALLDYYNKEYTEDIITATNISEEDEMPLPFLFRDFDEMPFLEQTALRTAKGTILNVGCGAGNHALYLQNKGLEVCAIDISEGAIEVAKKRGLTNVEETELLALNNQQFDTILLLTNGTGIFEKLENVAQYLQHLKTLVNPGGQILIDSSDLRYMYEQKEISSKTAESKEENQGGIWVPGDRYYGELDFTMSYKGQKSEPFPWLYLDASLFEIAAIANGFTFEILAHGEHYDYLAKLTIAENTPLQ